MNKELQKSLDFLEKEGAIGIAIVNTPQGGRIVMHGTPEDVVNHSTAVLCVGVEENPEKYKEIVNVLFSIAMHTCESIGLNPLDFKPL